MGPECKSRKSRDTLKTGKEYKIKQGKGFGVQNEAGQRLTGFVKKTRLSQQTPSYSNTRDSSTHAH